MEFPRWMYRQDVEKGRLFHTAKELEDAGEGWFDSPAFLHSVPDATGSTEEREDSPQIRAIEAMTAYAEKELSTINSFPPESMKPRRGRPPKVKNANLHTA